MLVRRILAQIVVGLFVLNFFVGMTPPAEAVELTDQQKLTLCVGQPDSCLVTQFFASGDVAPSHAWKHTAFLIPDEVNLGTLGVSNGYLLSVDGGHLVGLVQVAGKIYAIDGGPLPTTAMDGSSWFHAAMSYQNQAWRIYVDGQEVANRTDVTGTLASTTADLNVGRIDLASSRHLPGGVAEVRIFDRTLTAGEVVDLARIGEGLDPLDPNNEVIEGAIGAWPMDEGSGTAVNDSVGSADGTVVGGGSWVAHGADHGVMFDGVDAAITIPSFSFTPDADGVTVGGWFRLDPQAEGASSLQNGPVPLVGQWQAQPEVRFVDVGVRPGGSLDAMRHHLDDEVTGSWETLVLCRVYYKPGNMRACSTGNGPSVVNPAHNLDWNSPDDVPFFSTWRLALPADGVTTDVPSRVNGPDASVMRYTAPLRTGGGGDDNPQGHMDYDCEYIPFDNDTEMRTNGMVPPSLGRTACPSHHMVTSPSPPNSPPTGSGTDDLLWCEEGIEFEERWRHLNQTWETVLYPASVTCVLLQNPKAQEWNEFLGSRKGAFADNVTHLVTTTDPAEASSAASTIEEILRILISEHLALEWTGMGLPLSVTGILPNLVYDDFDGVGVQPSHLTLGAPRVADAVESGGWASVVEAARLAYSRTLLPVQVNFTAPNGEFVDRAFDLILEDLAPLFDTNVTRVQLGHDMAATIKADDPDNTDHASGFAPGTLLPFTYPLIKVTENDTDVAQGLFQTGFILPMANDTLEACVQQLWTADPQGNASNVLEQARLAIEPTNLTTCGLLNFIETVKLHLFETLTISLEVRETDRLTPHVWAHALVGSAEVHLVNKSQPGHAPTIDEAISTTFPVGNDNPIQSGILRIVIEVPTLPSATKAKVASALLYRLAGFVDTFAFELEGIPLPEHLNQAVERAVTKYGTVILVPAGSLPLGQAGVPVPDKLLSIYGLAAHPGVLTIGGGSLQDGSDPLNRLGPTPAYLPKPDFLAPSPAGTTIGAVLNTLPYVESMQLRGLRHTQTVRAVLAAFSVPVLNQHGAPATFYEQGYGALDLSLFLNLTLSTQDLVERTAQLFGRDASDHKANATATLGLANGTDLYTLPPNQVLGALASPNELLRSALGHTLINLTIDTPVIPSTLIIDHGVVNHARPGTAEIVPFDLDPVIVATMESIKLLLKEAGYTGTELDEVFNEAIGLAEIRAAAGQNVTVNLTHYYLFDLLKEDLLYSLYNKALDAAAADHFGFLNATIENFTLAPVQSLKDLLDGWLLKPYHFVPELADTMNTEVLVDRECISIPITSTVAFADKVIAVLNDQAGGLAGTLVEDQGAQLGEQVPVDSTTFISRSGQLFIENQVEQAACGRDVVALLEYLRELAQALHDLKQVPLGYWSEEEQLSGLWNETPIGQALNETLPLVGIDPTEFRQNGAGAVLEVTIEALDKALALIQQKIDLLGIPRTTLVDYDRPQLVTDPERTGATGVPLGPYVGLTMVTSKDVTLYNPFTDDVILRRDITIPLPAFLWNNPTLDIAPTYRDASPLLNATTTLYDAKEDVFDEIDLDLGFIYDNVTVPLWANLTRSLEAEQNGLIRLQTNLTAALANFTELAGTSFPSPYPMLANQTQKTLAAVEQRLAVVNESLSLASNVTSAALAPLLDKVLSELYSHMKYQSDYVDPATNKSTIHNLFPGSYRLWMPYPYHMFTNMSEDYPYANPGQGAFAQQIADPDMFIQEFVGGTLEGLVRYEDGTNETGEPLPEGAVPYPSNSTSSRYPIHEVDGKRYEPFHQFDLTVNGPDVLGLACLVVEHLANVTATPLGFPGCGTPLLNITDVLLLHEDLQMAKCYLGELVPANTSTFEGCNTYTTQGDDLDEACAGGDLFACMEANTTIPVEDSVLALRLALPSLLSPNSLTVPWPHSVKRLVASDPGAFDYDNETLVQRTLAANPNATLQAVEAAVAAFIGALDDMLDQAVTVDEPAHLSTLNVTEPLGLLYHVTDKVSGLDWWHSDIAPVDVDLANSTAAIRAELQTILDMVNETTDNGVLAPLIQSLLAENDATLVAAYEAGHAYTPDDRAARFAAGWRANGTVTKQLQPPTSESAVQVDLPWSEACQNAQNLTGLSPAYFDCGEGTVQQIIHPVCSVSPLRVDLVTMANDLLTSARHGTNPLVALERAVGMASAGAGWEWNRTENAIMAEGKTAAGCLEAPYSPLPAVLHYTTPLPPHEQFSMRMSGEFLTKETMAVIVVTPDDAVPEALLAALPNVTGIVDSGITLNPLERIMAALTNVSDVLEDDKHDVRVDILGFPLRMEVEEGPIVDLECVTCPRDTQGLIAVRSHDFHRFSRMYDFRSNIGGDDFGPNELHTLMLFFPSVSQSDDPGFGQKFIVRNLTMQIQSYAGLRENNWREDGLDMTLPIRYRANVEDWNMFYSVPDQPLAAGNMTGLDVTFQHGTNTLDQTQLFHAPGLNHTDFIAMGELNVGSGDSSLWGWCPQEHLPGREMREGRYRFWRQHGAEPVGDGYYWFTYQRDALCMRNTIFGLQPSEVAVPVPTELVVTPYYSFLEPEKALTEAMAYQVHFGDDLPIEDFTSVGGAPMGAHCLLCDPLSLISATDPREAAELVNSILQEGGLGASVLGEDLAANYVFPVADRIEAQRRLAEGTDATYEYLSEARRSLLPLALLDIPLLEPSFLVEKQNNRKNIPVPSDRLHSYLVMNASAVQGLMVNPWNPDVTMHVNETHVPALAYVPFQPSLENIVHTQNMSVVNEKNPYSVVGAWSVSTHYSPGSEASKDDPSDGGKGQIDPTVTHVAEFLLGNGQTGTGLAMVTTATGRLLVDDTDPNKVSDGLMIAGQAQFATIVFELGGVNTTGSDCGLVPLFNYVAKFFRCRGYSTAFAYGDQVGVNIEPTACLEPAMAYVRQGVENGTVLIGHDPLWKNVDPFNGMDFGDLLGPGYTPPTGGGDMNASIAKARTFFDNLTEDAEDLADCVDETLQVHLPTSPMVLLNHLVRALGENLSTFPDINTSRLNELARNLTKNVDPEVWAWGDPQSPGLTQTPLTVQMLADVLDNWTSVPTVDLDMKLSHSSASEAVTGGLFAQEHLLDGTPTGQPVAVILVEDQSWTDGTLNVTHERLYRLVANGTDVHGNAATLTRDIRADGVVPLFDPTPGAPAWVGAVPTIEWGGKDMLSGLHDVTVRVKQNGGEWETIAVFADSVPPGVTEPYSHILALVNATNATNEVQIVLRDKARNEAVYNFTVREDYLAPILCDNIQGGPVPQYLRADHVVACRVMDWQSGVAEVLVEQTGGDPPAPATFYPQPGNKFAWANFTVQVGTTDNVGITVDLTAEDKVGNEDALLLATTVDLSLPWLIAIPNPPAFLNTGKILSWTSQDNVSGLVEARLEQSVDGAAYADLPILNNAEVDPASSRVRNHVFDATGLHGSVVDLRYTETDRAGNTRVWTATRTVDALPPVLDLVPDVAPLGTGWFGQAIGVTLTAADSTSEISGQRYMFQGDSSWTEYIGTPIALEAGSHTIIAEAFDGAGNVGTVTKTFRIDTTEPIATLTGIEDGLLGATSLTSSVTLDPTGSNIESATLTFLNVTSNQVMQAITVQGREYQQDWQSGLAGWTHGLPDKTTFAIEARDAGSSDLVAHQAITTLGLTNWLQSPTMSASADYDLFFRFDWKRNTIQTSGEHSIGIEVTLKKAATTKILCYQLLGLGGCNGHIDIDLRPSAPANGVWQSVERNVRSDTESLSGYEVTKIAFKSTRTGFFTASELWLGDITLDRNRNGETVHGSLAQDGLFHSAMYRIDALVTDSGGRTASGSTGDFIVWITPVPEIDLEGVLGVGTYLSGVLVSQVAANSTIVMGNGLTGNVVADGPANTALRVTHLNGTESNAVGATISVATTLDAFGAPGRASHVNAFASTPAGSWNDTDFVLEFPVEKIVLDSFEAVAEGTTLSAPVNGTDFAETVRFNETADDIHRVSGNSSLRIALDPGTAASASAEFDVHVPGGAQRAFAFVTLDNLSQPTLDDRTTWTHVLSARNGTLDILRVGFLDSDNRLDIGHGSAQGNTTTFDVVDLVPDVQHKIEIRVYDDDVEVYVDNVLVGTFERMWTGRFDRLFMGGSSGTGDVGAFYVDDVTVHQRPIVGHMVLDDRLATTTDWASLGSGVSNATTGEGRPFGRYLNITSSAASPSRAWRAVTVEDSVTHWSAYVRRVASTASPGDSTSWIDLLHLKDASGGSVGRVVLVDGATIGVVDNTTMLGTRTTLSGSDWYRLDAILTPRGYRVWVNEAPIVATASGATTFALGPGLLPANLTLGGGNGTIHATWFRADTSEQFDLVTAERAYPEWNLTATGGGSAVARLSGLSAHNLTAVSGDQMMELKSPASSGATARAQTDLVLAERFVLRGWAALEDDVATGFDDFTLLRIGDAADAELAAARLDGALGTVSLTARDDGLFRDTGVTVPLHEWMFFEAEVDQSNRTWFLRFGEAEWFGALANSTGPASRVAMGDLIASGIGGAGWVLYDDIEIVRWSQAPVPVVESHGDGDIERGDFTLSGSIRDEAQDALGTLEYRVGAGNWTPIDRQRHWSVEANAANLVNGTKYWINVRADDGDRRATSSVLVCYKEGSGDCAGGPTVGTKLVSIER